MWGLPSCIDGLSSPSAPAPLSPFFHSLWPGFRSTAHPNPGPSYTKVCFFFLWLFTPSHLEVIYPQIQARVLTPGACSEAMLTWIW